MNAFIAVAETRNFTQAARRLNISQPVVSRAIQRLEDRIGAKLFERGAREVRLTAAGEALAAEASEIFDRWRVALNNARLIGQGEVSQLRIGICESAELGAPQLAAGLRAFNETRPKVRIQLSSFGRSTQIAALRASEIDVGMMQLSDLERARLEVLVFSRAPLMIAVPRVWNLPKRSYRLADLADWPWITAHPKLSVLYERHLQICRAAGFEPKIAAFAEDNLTGKVLVAAGLGVAMTYSRQANEGVDYRLLTGVSDTAFSDTALVWAEGVSSPLVQDFVRCVEQAGLDGVSGRPMQPEVDTEPFSVPERASARCRS
jgi:DNA-binding transcriptional LysR family regulator